MAKVWKKLQRADGDFTGTIDGTSAGDVKTGAVAGTAAKTITDAAFDGDTKLKTANAQAGMINSNTTATDVGLENVTNESKASMFASPTFTGTVAGVDKAAVGLANVANESPSTLKTTMSLNNVTNESKSTMFASPTFTGSISGVDKDDVGLGNVDNESKASILGGTFTGAVSTSATVDGTAFSTVKSGAASGATANQDSTSTILGGTFTGDIGGTSAANIKSGAAAGATANQDSTSTILGGTLTGAISTSATLGGTAMSTVKSGAASGATANQDSTSSIRAGTTAANVGLGSVINQAVTVAGGKLKLDGTAQTMDADTVDGDSKATIKAAAVSTAETNIVGSAPGVLNTLDELAAALNDDASFNSTITTSIATKAVKPVTISNPSTTPTEDVGVQGIYADELYVVQDV